MRKPFIKGTICVLIFIISVLIISAITNKGNTDMTVEMKPATYPLVYMELEGERINCLHGYASRMQESYLRDTITPIDEDRVVTFSIDKFQGDIQALSFEVRSVDGSRLIEETDITDVSDENDTVRASVTLKDLIEQNQEYCFILLVETGYGEVIRYYTRIIQPVDYHVKEKIAFVKDFHEKTFTKDESISRYLESNAEGDNTSYHLVNIHSNFSQITWGNMNIKKVSEPVISIKELGTQTASIRMDYFVSEENHEYRISEFYRVRYGSDRMYLLDFERTMNQLFDTKDDVFVNNKILLGISEQDVEMQESDDGNIIAFNHENSLYSYNVTDNRCVCLFSFYNSENRDLRDVYNQHDMKILSVEESGNIRFMVYGYMNRGRHEGEVGIQVYYYNSVLNTIEEDAFIQYDKSYELLREEIEQLAYVSKNSIFYFILDGTIHSVDLTNKTSGVVAKNLAEDTFKVSKDNQMIVWQTEQEKYNRKKLILMNLNTKKKTTIEVSADKRIAPLGFMNSDLIYGIAEKGDIVKEKSGIITFPMNEVIIQNEDGEILKDYKQDNIYVIDGQIENNQLNMTRVKKIGTDVGEEENDSTVSENEIDTDTDTYINTNQYEEIADDQIMNNVVEETGKNTVETVTTTNYEKIVQIVLESTIQTNSIKFQTPKEVLFEGGREIVLAKTKEETERYYVYGKHGIESIFTKPAAAINLASEISGVVLNDQGEYVWRKGNLSTKNQIMKIEATKTEEQSSIAICLDTMLAYENVMRNSEYLLSNGGTVYSVLNDNLEDAQVLILSGCSLESILYYVNQDIPVMAMLDDGNAVLIIGFNELNTVIMDPETGTIYKKGMNDSKAWFEENGNSFITYIKKQ